MNRADRYSLLLLAGGKSARMGKNKAELLYRGMSFLEWMVEKARVLGIEEMYISGYPQEHKQVHVVYDVYPDRGPLGGLHACMKEMKTPFCLVLPVDSPTLPTEILEEMIRKHEQDDIQVPLLWEHGERKEPLIAIYPVSAAEKIEDLIRNGSAPVFRALDRTGYICWRREMDEKQIINVNTPELYEELLKRENES